MATASQEAAFTSGAGGTLTMGNVSLVIALICSTLILLFAGWVIISKFKAWNRGRIDLYDLSWAVVRVFLVVIIFGYYVRP